jgi:primosomal protein N' (replication factor Y)
MFNSENYQPSTFASVAVSVPVGPFGELTYRMPEALHARLCPGMRVLVPVGRRKVTGIVTKIGVICDLQDSTRVKDILSIMDESPIFSEDLIGLWSWSSNYYLSSPGEMLKTILPVRGKSESVRVVKVKGAKKKRTSRGQQTENETALIPDELTSIERDLLALVSEKKRVTTKNLRRRFPEIPLEKVLKKLESFDLVEVSEHLPQRKTSVPFGKPAEEPVPGDEDASFVLSMTQEKARAEISVALHPPAFSVFLLHGVTGSGKTEVYLRLAQEAVACGKGVLILVPEIGLTRQLIERARRYFGQQVAVLHSGLGASQRWAEWWRIARGEATVVVGVRSAVFAPIRQLGFVVVDEEHDTSYKQEEGARYNARDLAVMRGKISSCPVILGSATPSLESYTHGRSHRYTILTLPDRVALRPLPSVEIVDLRQEARSGNRDRVFSIALREALLSNYQAEKQSVLFLNRRGYASYLQCHLCGEVVSCPHCSVTLRFHLQEKLLRCHYCGFCKKTEISCPRCHEPTLIEHGFGTEQVEKALRGLIPGVRIGRLDRDSVKRRNALSGILSAWHAHDIDVLIGTQMVAKGHDVPNVTLVGVLLADVSLNLPDFRAAERTFQLLTQVAGRAGRGQDPGRVIIQTYTPDHYSVRCAAQHDFARFAAYELRYRKSLGYPPFTRMVNLRFEGKDGAKVQARAEQTAQFLLNNLQEGGREQTVVLGPAPAAIERVKDRERWQVLVKSKDRRALHLLVRKAQETLFARRADQAVRVVVDVDPYSML